MTGPRLEPREPIDEVAGRPDGEPTAAPGTVTPAGRTIPLAEVCPFLRAIDATDRIHPPALAPDPVNRCLATGEPVAVSGRDQAALCLAATHVDCSRYLRATLHAPAPAPAFTRSRPRLSAPIIASLAVLGIAAAVAFGSVVLRGGLSIGAGESSPASSPSTSAVGGGPESGPLEATRPSIGGVVPPAASAGLVSPTAPAPSIFGQASSAPTPMPTSSATGASTPSPTPRRTHRPKPASYPALTPCPGVADCYVYVVRRGDSLSGIATRYGVTLQELLDRNPEIRDPSTIYLGQEIRLPTPRT